MPRSSRNPGAIVRAPADPACSNRLVAQAARCDLCTVQRARKAMERAGDIPLTPVRAERPKPPPRSRSRDAIAELAPRPPRARLASYGERPPRGYADGGVAGPGLSLMMPRNG